MVVHTLKQKQFHGEVEFKFLTHDGCHPTTDEFWIEDGQNINDVKMIDGEFIGEWESQETSFLDLLDFLDSYLNSNH